MAQQLKANRTAGFTLIELLIAITILSLVVGIASYSFSLFSGQWGERDVAARSGVNRLQRIELLARAMEDTVPWLVRDNAGQLGFYFLGRDEGFTFVTGSPIFSTGAPAVVRLFREQVEGSWQLVYEEASLQGVILTDAQQQLPFAHRLIIIDERPRVEFRYFGWGSIEDKVLAGDNLASRAQWFAEYDGLVRTQHPQSVAITVGDIEAVFEVASRSDLVINKVIVEE